MAHVTRIKAGDKKSDDAPKKDSTSKNVKKAVKIAKEIVKEEKSVAKSTKSANIAKPAKADKSAKKDKSAKVKTKKSGKKMSGPVRVLTAPFRYIRDSWLEIRQVKWPNRKATWGLVGSIFIYAAFFIVLVMLLDALFNFIFSQIIG